jgi:ribosomal protein S18 acetylase RimI-like enzyme
MADDLDALAPLFDAYRVSYGGAPDPNRSRRFLGERLRTGQSMVLIALKGTETVGFAMLYPSFTSIHLQRLWILSDLFIRPEFRREGAARALVERAADIARETGARGVVLQAPPDNRPAKELYASLQFVEEQRTHHYFLETIA